MNEIKYMQAQPLINNIAKHVRLTPGEESLLLSKANYRRYLKGQYVTQQGDICRFESFVLSGCLKTFHVDQEGDEHIIRFAIENWWVGDLGSFITQSPADSNIQCLEPTELLQFSYQSLEQLYLEIPKLERFFRITIQKEFINSEKRLINNVSLPAKERYLRFKQQFPQIEQRVPQYLIASYLGITKEFLSRIKNQMIIRK